MKQLAKASVFALTALVLSASAALAQIDVELAFDPSSASPGDQVHFFASVANLGDEPVVADLELTISFSDLVLGPLSAPLPLAAGEEHSVELILLIPPLPISGELTITVSATAGEFTDTASASLTIVSEVPGSEGDLNAMGQQVLNALTSDDDTSPVEAVNFTNVKRLYR